MLAAHKPSIGKILSWAGCRYGTATRDNQAVRLDVIHRRRSTGRQCADVADGRPHQPRHRHREMLAGRSCIVAFAADPSDPTEAVVIAIYT